MLTHLDLAGDGDEIDAIERVEEEFGVTLDKQAASSWRTAGDVYASLLRQLPEDLAQQPTTWLRFRKALCDPTADKPEDVEPETALLGPRIAWIDKILSFLAG
ncbi:MAG TPA: acyl carrier protein [Caulobacteraceae bacterium]